jgi:hypothetical protein
MQHNSKVVAVYVHFPADLVFVTLFPEDKPNKRLIPWRQLGNDVANLAEAFVLTERFHRVNDCGGLQILRAIHADIAALGTGQLQDDVIADTGDVRSELLGLIEQVRIAAQIPQNTEKGFLNDIFDYLPGTVVAADLHDKQSSKPLIEMVFYRLITTDETVDVISREWIVGCPWLSDDPQYSRRLDPKES